MYLVLVIEGGVILKQKRFKTKDDAREFMCSDFAETLCNGNTERFEELYENDDRCLLDTDDAYMESSGVETRWFVIDTELEWEE